MNAYEKQTDSTNLQQQTSGAEQNKLTSTIISRSTCDVNNTVPNHTDTILDTSLDQSDIQRITDTSETIIAQLHQLTNSITADTHISNLGKSLSQTSTSATLRRDTNTYVCTPDKSQPCHSHFTVPFVPIAESTPLKSPIPQKTTVDTATSPIVKQDLTFSHSLSLPEHTPLSKEEEKLSTHLVRRKLHHDPQKNTIKCKTGGQPLVLQKVVAPRKYTTLVRTPTKRKRAKILSKVRSYVAGPSETSADTQLATELKALPTTRRQHIVQRIGVKQKLRISRHYTLAIKEALGMSWRQGRKHGKLLKQVGVHLENERSVRALSKELVSDFVQVEDRLFIREEDSEYRAPYGRIAGLTSFVDRLLDSYEKQNMLTWHKDTIPRDEIWVKIGGDHGKNSLKFTLQIANTDRPNARQNTIVIALAAVRDTHENIVRFLEGGLGDELVALQSHSWNGKAIKVFLNGDYDFLCKMYGLSGPQGTYPCLWCLMPRRDMNNPADQCQHRSVESLLADNKKFMDEADGERKQANKFFNSLHAPLLRLDLENVCPPYLHILLGVVLKHHKFLENAAHDLDEKVASQPDTFLLPLGMLLKKYGAQWGRAYELQERLVYEEGCLGFSELNDSQQQIDKYTQQIHKTESLISFLIHKELQPRVGPIASALDTVLNKHRITPQAYHSRSFVGNHCHKYLQTQVYTDLTQTIVTRTQQCTSNPMIVDEAFTLQLVYNNLNSALSIVHKPYPTHSLSHTTHSQT